MLTEIVGVTESSRATTSLPLPLLLADSDTAGATTFTVTPLSSDGIVIPTGNVAITGVGGSRQVVVTPAAIASGASTITLNVRDVANNQSDDLFVVTVTPVNDAPSFTPGPNMTVLEDSGAQNVPWASGISAGPANESGQQVTFAVTGNSNPALFAAAPAVAANGALTFTPATNANGSADLSVQLSDNGGTVNGGVNVSAPVNVTITVTPVNDPPSVTLPGSPVSYNAGGAEAVIDPGATVADIDSANLDGGQLTAQITSGGGPMDFLEIRDSAGPDPVDVNGNSLSVGGVQIGSFSAGSGAAPLQVTLNASATPARMQAVVRNLTFRTTATASAGARTLTVQVSELTLRRRRPSSRPNRSAASS